MNLSITADSVARAGAWLPFTAHALGACLLLASGHALGQSNDGVPGPGLIDGDRVYANAIEQAAAVANDQIFRTLDTDCNPFGTLDQTPSPTFQDLSGRLQPGPLCNEDTFFVYLNARELVHTANENEYDFSILQAVLDVNDRQREVLAERVIAHFGGNVAGRTLAVWGLAFKANTDDVREAPSHIIIQILLDAGARIVAYDPEATETTRAVLGDRITYASEAYAALEGADALLVCTEWNEFRRPDFDRMRKKLAQKLVFDGRNLYDPVRMAELGFEYHSIGRPSFAVAGAGVNGTVA